MKIHKEIIQGCRDWHEIKFGKIGGTRAKGLFVKSDTLLIELVSELTEDFEIEESYSSDAMLRGQDLEPLGRERLEDLTGVKFIDVGWIDSSILNVGISPDGISEDNKIMCEIKCPGRKKHVETILADEIPSDYIHQCLHYFTVNEDLEKLYFVSFRPEALKQLFVKELTKQSEINLGTKARPQIKTVSEWVEIARFEAIKLNKEIEINIEKLTF